MGDFQTREGWWVLDRDVGRTLAVVTQKRLDWDAALLGFVTQFIKPGDVVVDAGASIGDHTIAYQQAVGSDGYVIAYEPFWDAYKCLLRNCHGKNITSYNLGLGEHCCNMGIRTPRIGDQGTSNLTEDSDGPVTVVNLDHHWHSWPDRAKKHLDFIKIDVEGMELQVLRGAVKLIAKHHPALFVECYRELLSKYHATPGDIKAFMEETGYNSFQIYEPEGTWEWEYFNVLATRA